MRFPCLLLLVTLPGLSAVAGEAKERPAEEKASIKPVSEEVVPERSYVPLAEATPTPRYLYLLRSVSVMTDVGVLGVVPGTRLALIEERDDGFHVAHNGQKFVVERDAITFSHEEATAAHEAYVAAQRRIHEEIQQKLEAAYQAEMERRLKMKGMTER